MKQQYEKSTLTSPEPLSHLQKDQAIALLTCSHECSQANIPTYCPPGFYPFLLLGLFFTYRKQAELPSCCMSSSSPFPCGALGAWDEACQAAMSTRHSFPHPAHDGHKTHLHFGGTSRTTHLSSNSQGSEQSLRAWRPFHIFPPTSMTKLSHFCLLLSLA